MKETLRLDSKPSRSSSTTKSISTRNHSKSSSSTARSRSASTSTPKPNQSSKSSSGSKSSSKSPQSTALISPTKGLGRSNAPSPITPPSQQLPSAPATIPQYNYRHGHPTIFQTNGSVTQRRIVAGAAAKEAYAAWYQHRSGKHLEKMEALDQQRDVRTARFVQRFRAQNPEIESVEAKVLDTPVSPKTLGLGTSETRGRGGRRREGSGSALVQGTMRKGSKAKDGQGAADTRVRQNKRCIEDLSSAGGRYNRTRSSSRGSSTRSSSTHGDSSHGSSSSGRTRSSSNTSNSSSSSRVVTPVRAGSSLYGPQARSSTGSHSGSRKNSLSGEVNEAIGDVEVLVQAVRVWMAEKKSVRTEARNAKRREWETAVKAQISSPVPVPEGEYNSYVQTPCSGLPSLDTRDRPLLLKRWSREAEAEQLKKKKNSFDLPRPNLDFLKGRDRKDKEHSKSQPSTPKENATLPEANSSRPSTQLGQFINPTDPKAANFNPNHLPGAPTQPLAPGQTAPWNRPPQPQKTALGKLKHNIERRLDRRDSDTSFFCAGITIEDYENAQPVIQEQQTARQAAVKLAPVDYKRPLTPPELRRELFGKNRRQNRQPEVAGETQGEALPPLPSDTNNDALSRPDSSTSMYTTFKSASSSRKPQPLRIRKGTNNTNRSSDNAAATTPRFSPKTRESGDSTFVSQGRDSRYKEAASVAASDQERVKREYWNDYRRGLRDSTFSRRPSLSSSVQGKPF